MVLGVAELAAEAKVAIVFVAACALFMALSAIFKANLCCKMAAVDGNTISGVDVATIIKSTSPTPRPAASSAARHAGSARSLALTSGAAKWRAWMPVRSTIHSSEVTTPLAASSAAKSALVRRRGGKKLPVPVILEYFAWNCAVIGLYYADANDGVNMLPFLSPNGLAVVGCFLVPITQLVVGVAYA